MKIQWKMLIVCLLIPLAVGGVSALLTSGGMQVFGTLQKPPLSPPAWLFPVAWTILYLLMGLASYFIVNSHAPQTEKTSALTMYGIQLGFNFFWSVLFFNFKLYFLSFFWLLALWALILTTLILFYRIEKKAGYLMIPYLLWVSFAGYLNLAIAFLN